MSFSSRLTSGSSSRSWGEGRPSIHSMTCVKAMRARSSGLASRTARPEEEGKGLVQRRCWEGAVTHIDRERADGRRRELRAMVSCGSDVLTDGELLELVLARTLTRQDPGPLRDRLLSRFTSFAGVMGATAGELRQVQGVTPAIASDLLLVGVAMRRTAAGACMGRAVLSSWAAVQAYLRVTQGHRTIEVFGVLLLDIRNQLIADEELWSGTINHAPAYPREIMRLALERGAANLLLYHRHPSGDPSPSRADIDMTRQIIEAGRTLSVGVHDHIIVGATSVASFKALGLI